MEQESRISLEYKFVMEDGADTMCSAGWPVLTSPAPPSYRRSSSTRFAICSFARVPRIIKRHDGEPKLEPPKDPNLKSWSAHLIGGSKMQHLGFVEGVNETGAIDAAVALFGLDDQKRRRPPVNLRR
ncbi:MAG: hypothetical protein J2P54_01070 [Bradyrhizobiaceae bacterium]|nr:hypothetical protein [Bradyrhizobiaceae bacterium]